MRDVHPHAEVFARLSGTRISFPTRPGSSDGEACFNKGNVAPSIHTIRYRVAVELAHSTGSCGATIDVFGDLFVKVILMGIAVANKFVFTIPHATNEVVTE